LKEATMNESLHRTDAGELGGQALSPKQLVVLEELLKGRKQTAAARLAGVHRNTVGRWLHGHEAFRTAYHAQCERLLQEGLARARQKYLAAIERTWRRAEDGGRRAEEGGWKIEGRVADFLKTATP
jgi:acyl-coenzyme A synthetase/AMP-(fatty) acid ligase